LLIEKPKETERRVIAREMAHKISGERYAGNVQYSYTREPDSKMYITGGKVSVDTSEESDP
jgi:hypothetical protein